MFRDKTSAAALDELSRAVRELSALDDSKQGRREYGDDVAVSGETDGVGIFSKDELNFIRSELAAAARRSEELLHTITS